MPVDVVIVAVVMSSIMGFIFGGMAVKDYVINNYELKNKENK